ncbi:hypothetical protein [Thauera humireducens]|uniref:hypothetical protein n=1 Tax=Thauera humireducens TaxID=1134435 RepID=UPI00311FF257
MSESRIHCVALGAKIMSADEAAAPHPNPASTIGMSGFTGSGYPKAVPAALARRIEAENARGQALPASGCGPGRRPHQARRRAGEGRRHRDAPALPVRPGVRERINAGEMEYIDIHLSHVAQFVWFGFLGKLGVAVVEVAEHPARRPADSVLVGG